MQQLTDKQVFCVVLAAGSSERFGSTKQLARLDDGDTLISRAVRTARQALGDRTLIVLGHDWQAVRSAAGTPCPYFVINDDFAAGIGTSIAAAASAIRDVADAILLVLADQPGVTRADLEMVLGAWSGDAFEIVAASYAGTRGPPVLLPAGTFEDLERLDGDRGARDLMGDSRFSLKQVDVEAAAADIDTPEDL